MAKRRKTVKKAAGKVTRIEFPSLSFKINPIALGYTIGIVRVIVLATLTILGKMGYALEAISFMQQFHFTYSLAPLGIVSGLAETALWGIIAGYIFGKIYNKLS